MRLGSMCVPVLTLNVGPNYNGSQQQNKGSHKAISIGTIDPTRKFYGKNSWTTHRIPNVFGINFIKLCSRKCCWRLGHKRLVLTPPPKKKSSPSLIDNLIGTHLASEGARVVTIKSIKFCSFLKVNLLFYSNEYWNLSSNLNIFIW